MTSDDHNTPLEAGDVVRYPSPEDDPDMHEYDNEGDAWVVEEQDGR
jgi:hypothetical protein